jgi:hypothetical protein
VSLAAKPRAVSAPAVNKAAAPSAVRAKSRRVTCVGVTRPLK